MQQKVVQSFWTQRDVRTESCHHLDECCLTDKRPEYHIV
jgi:hypothetical protein